MKDTRKTIKVSEEVFKRLTELGRMNQSYSELIFKLIQFYKKHGKKGRDL